MKLTECILVSIMIMGCKTKICHNLNESDSQSGISTESYYRTGETDSLMNRLRNRICKLDYQDSVVQNGKTGSERAAYFLSLLDSVDLYDPLSDSTARLSDWYSYSHVNPITWEERMVIDVYTDPAAVVIQCSDRYKLLWFTHKSLFGIADTSIHYPFVVKNGVGRDSIVTFDIISKSCDSKGHTHRKVKTNTRDYIVLKEYYSTVLKSGKPDSDNHFELNSIGYHWNVTGRMRK